jgi:hypothetical protein
MLVQTLLVLALPALLSAAAVEVDESFVRSCRVIDLQNQLYRRLLNLDPVHTPFNRESRGDESHDFSDKQDTPAIVKSTPVTLYTTSVLKETSVLATSFTTTLKLRVNFYGTDLITTIESVYPANVTKVNEITKTLAIVPSKTVSAEISATERVKVRHERAVALEPPAGSNSKLEPSFTPELDPSFASEHSTRKTEYVTVTKTVYVIAK